MASCDPLVRAFRLFHSDERTVLVDPCSRGTRRRREGGLRARADLLLLTHDHFDHAGDAVALARKTGPSSWRSSSWRGK